MDPKYFEPIPDGLPKAEAAARLKRQRHAEWGVAVCRLGGTLPDHKLIAELQRYINGEITIAQVAGVVDPPMAAAVQAIVTRERLSKAA
ncbi:antitoxin VbhA family protein [Hymenobacter koreensis]|uniref:Antitoxin VbhA domain-containing protein n=1 Tax=Hymenobacter koreensis TaxID=1084523 RepID=A0ABP8IT54_9BACT